MYAAFYVKMCQHLVAVEVASSTNPTETTNFRKLLLKKCQLEFGNIVRGLVNIEKMKEEIEANKDVRFDSQIVLFPFILMNHFSNF